MKSITIKMRLIITLSVLSALLLVVGGIGIMGMGQAKDGLQTVYEDRAVPLMDLGLVIDMINRIRTNAVVAMSADKSETVDRMIADTRELDGEIARLWSKFMATTLTPEEEVLAGSFDANWRSYVESRNRTLNSARSGDFGQARINAAQDAGPKFTKAREDMFKLIELQGRVAGEEYRHAVDSYNSVLMISIAAIVLGMLLTLVMSWLLIRAITVPINEAVTVANRIAKGDLDNRIEVKSNDEVGKLLTALKTMNEQLLNIVGNVRTASDAVGSSAREIASGNDDLSQRTQEQASALEESASSMEEMTSTVKQNADNARQANQLALGARDQAEQGGQVVSMAVSAMNEINASSHKIADIISVIDEIAFQTNLLALNAAVEAARAGEQGRGFAVVAAEVRNLAQRSAGAAKEIKDLIQDSVEKVKTGSGLVDESGKTLTEIVDSVKKVTDIVAEIAAASQEQSVGIEQVNKAITQMDEVTQQNAALVEEAAAASRSMEEQARRLVETMEFFQVGALTAMASAPAAMPASAKAKPAAKPAARPQAAARPAPQPARRPVVNDDEWQEF